jgi:predicted DNA-binding transcriptional regulator AlpA
MSAKSTTPSIVKSPNCQTHETNPLAAALETGRLLSGKEVATLFGYKSRAAFWTWVAREQPPHVRLSARNIRFPALALQTWMDKRDNTKGQP